MYFRKNDLSNLLNSLSLAEKRKFYRYLKAQNYKDTPFFMQLLKVFDKDESELIHYPETASAQAHTNAKRRLYKHLLQCLHEYHQEKSPETIIHNLLCKVEILYDHGLPDQSAVLLRKVHDLALMQEHYGLMLQILDWERKLNIILDQPQRSNKEIAREEKKILDNLNQIINLKNICSKAREIKRRYGYAKGPYRGTVERTTIKSPYLTTLYKPSSQRAKYYYHFIHCLYYTMVFNTKQSYLHSKELLNPKMQRIPPNEYLEGILEHITSCVSLGYFEETLSLLQVADAFMRQKQLTQFTSFSLIVFYFRICYSLIAYTYTGAVASLQSTIEEAEEKLELYHKQLSLERKIVIYGNLRNAYVAAGDLDKAEAISEKILQKEARFVRSDVYNDMFLFRIFSFLASGTYVLVPAMALSAYRRYSQLEAQDDQQPLGMKITAILMKDYNYSDKKIRSAVLLKVKELLVSYIASLKGLNNFHEMYSFYAIWTESMLMGEPFHVVASAWHARHAGMAGDERQ